MRLLLDSHALLWFCWKIVTESDIHASACEFQLAAQSAPHLRISCSTTLLCLSPL